MTDDRDYRQELDQGLHAMFGEHLANYSIENDNRNQAMWVMAPGGGLQSVPLQQDYRLTVQVAISLAELMKRSTHRDPSFTRLLRIGNYTPTGVDQHQDYALAKYVVRVSYHISDLDDFLENLNKQAWETYGNKFTEAMDEVLDDSDKK